MEAIHLQLNATQPKPVETKSSRPVTTRASREPEAHALPDSAAVEAREAKAQVATEKSRQVVQRVAHELNRQFGSREVRFTVRDPSKVTAHNVIIEIREGDRVIATIPSEEVLAMAERLDEGRGVGEVKGALLDQHG